ncbi:hypothetical protein GVAV_001423 [Gurleya vavrai]
MHNYLAVIDNFIYTIKDNILVKINIENDEIEYKAYENKLIFIKNSFIVDIKKNLFNFITGEKIIKLSKNIADLDFKDKLYICNRFGDVKTISGEEENLIFGNICLTSSMLIDKFIWAGDKYGRVRISEFSGKIEKIVFLKSAVLCMQRYKNNILVATEDKILYIIDKFNFSFKSFEIGQKIFKILVDDNVYLLCENSYLICKMEPDFEILHKIEQIYIDGIFKENLKVFLKKNGEIWINGNLKLDMKTDFNTNFKLLQYH